MPTTREAANIAGVKYESLRNWLKRGLLQHAQPQERAWRRYSETDYCILTLMREGLAAGISVETMIDVCQDREVQRLFERLVDGHGYASFAKPHHLLIWQTSPEALFMLAHVRSIPDELAANPSPVTLFDLTHIQEQAQGRIARHA